MAVVVHLIYEDPSGKFSSKAPISTRSGRKQYSVACDPGGANGRPANASNLAVAVTCKKCIESDKFKELAASQNTQIRSSPVNEEIGVNPLTKTAGDSPANPQ